VQVQLGAGRRRGGLRQAQPAERLPCPKPQKAQPTTQTLETLMLRLTTKVTVSPASSARSSSAASRISSIASARVSANIAVSSSALSAMPSRPLAIAPTTRSGRIGVGASVRPEPRRGMKLQYLTLIVSSTAGAIQSGSM